MSHDHRPPRTGHLPTGYRGPDPAVPLGGAHPARVAANDPAAGRLPAHRWPGVPNLGDITHIDATRLLPADRVICRRPRQQQPGPAPTGTGITGSRCRAWRQLAAAVGHLRPGHAFLENMAGPAVRGPAVVQAHLATLRHYPARVCLCASDLGAGHCPDRVLLPGHAADAADPVRA